MNFKKQKEEKTEDIRTQSQIRAENEELMGQLTNKNNDFMFQFQKIAEDHDFRGRDHDRVFNRMLHELIDKQGSGVTARQLYGTPAEFAEKLDAMPTEEELAPSPFWQYWVEGGLFIGGIFCIMAGVVLMFATKKEAANPVTFGPAAMVVNFVVGGLAMAVLNTNQIDYDAPKGQKGIGRYFLLLILVIVLWMGALVLAVRLTPSSWNKVLNPLVYLAIGIGALAVRHWFRKKYNMTY